MLRLSLRQALQAGIEAGDDDVARAHVAHGDPVLRPCLRRRFDRLLIDATIEAVDAATAAGQADATWAASGQPDAVCHRMKVASLRLAGGAAPSAHDRDAVAQAYAALPRLVQSRRTPWFTGLAALVVIAIAAMVVWSLMRGPGGQVRRVGSRTAPAMSTSVAGAFVSGGAPLVDETLAAVLRERLPALVIATDRIANTPAGGTVGAADAAARAALSAQLRSEPWFVRRGGAVHLAWLAVLDALDAWAAEQNPSQARIREIIDEVIARARALSDQFAAEGLGYYLEGDGFGSGAVTHAVLYAYRVEHVAFVDVGGHGRRVLSLRRIDKLNLQRALLGMESATLGDPMVLLDQIDEHVVTQLLPTLVAEAWYDIGDPVWQTASDGDGHMRGLVGTAVRREILAALGTTSSAAQAVARLVVERRTILEAVAETLRPRGIAMNFPDEIFVGEGYLDSLDGSISHSQGDRLTEIESELQQLDAAAVAQQLQQILVATVRRHEAQHGLDGSEALPYPKVVELNVGPEEIGDRENAHGTSINAELSAYVSQLANDPVTPKLAFWSLARHAFSEVNWGRAESYVAVIVVEGLAQQLRLASPGPAIHDGQIDRHRLRQVALAVSAVAPADLRLAAAAFWTALYHRPFVPIEDRKLP
ncbi:MAG: hypothetical protein KBG15_06620 [Kofleriaceae bacterium]|nr:hypothetical protein [Kofleriaceae bacterium]